LDTDSWTDIFSPNFDALFEFVEPEKTDPLYLGNLVKNVSVFTMMTLIKNIYLVMVSSIVDDLHIVSVLFATPFALLAICATYVPYGAALFCWKNIEYVNAMDFNFEFDHRIRTATFGGIFFGIQVLPQLLLTWVMPALMYGKEKWDVYVKEMKKPPNEQEPDLWDMTFWKQTCKFLIVNSNQPVGQYLVQGVIGLSCFGWAARDSGDEYAMSAYWLLLACTLSGAVVSCSCLGLKTGLEVKLDEQKEAEK